MKNLFKWMMLIAVAAVAFACAKEETAEPTPEPERPVVVNFNASMEDLTRVSLEESDTAIKSAWEATDHLGVYVRYYNSDSELKTSSKRNNIDFSYTGTNFEGEIEPATAVSWLYGAYYPYISGTTNSSVTIPIGQERVQYGNTYNSAYDLMDSGLIEMATSEVGKDTEGNDITFAMKRQSALVYFHFTSSEAWAANEKVLLVELTGSEAIGCNTIKYKRDIAGFETSSVYKTITLIYDEATRPTAADFKAYFNIIPDLDADAAPTSVNTKLTVTVYTENHKVTYTRDAKEYKMACCYRNNIAIAADKWEENATGPLTAPVINAEAKATYESVTFTWSAVKNATGYAYSINGGVEQTTASTSVTISDLTPEMEYAYTLTVRALGDNLLYYDSESATQNFSFTTPAAPAAGTTTTYVWDFASADFDSYAEAIGTSDNKTYVDTWNGLTITAGGGSIKMTSGNGTRCLRLGGSGSKTKRVLSFVAKGTGTLTVIASNTGSSDDTTRTLAVSVNGVVSKQVAGTATSNPSTCEYSISVTEDTTVYIYPAVNGLNIYSVTYVETI